MHDKRVLDVVEVLAFEQAGFGQLGLDRVGAFLGPADVLGLLVRLVPFGVEILHDRIDRDIELALVLGRAGDDQRGTRFVDQDRIDLVDDRVIEGTMHHLVAIVLHVVAQIIEAELVVRPVGDVRIIRVAPLELVQVRHDHTDRQAEETVKLPHPFRVAAGEIVVHGDDMDTLALDRVKIGGQRRHQRLALARAHFGDLAAMENDTAYHLHVEMPHAEHADRGFAHGRERFGQDVVQRLAVFQLLAELVRLGLQLFIGQSLKLLLQRVDLIDDLVHRLDVTIVGRAEERLG